METVIEAKSLRKTYGETMEDIAMSERGAKGRRDITRVGDDIKDEARVHLAAWREMGPEYEDELIDSFVEKVEESLKASQTRVQSPPSDSDSDIAKMICIGLCLVIPLTAVAGTFGGSVGIAAVWSAMAALFLLHYYQKT